MTLNPGSSDAAVFDSETEATLVALVKIYSANGSDAAKLFYNNRRDELRANIQQFADDLQFHITDEDSVP